jgi:hypothetical protein
MSSAKVPLVAAAAVFLAVAGWLWFRAPPPWPAHEDCVGLTLDEALAAYGQPGSTTGTRDGPSLSLYYRRRERGGTRLAAVHFRRGDDGVFRCFRVAPVWQED